MCTTSQQSRSLQKQEPVRAGRCRLGSQGDTSGKMTLAGLWPSLSEGPKGVEGLVPQSTQGPKQYSVLGVCTLTL